HCLSLILSSFKVKVQSSAPQITVDIFDCPTRNAVHFAQRKTIRKQCEECTLNPKARLPNCTIKCDKIGVKVTVMLVQSIVHLPKLCGFGITENIQVQEPCVAGTRQRRRYRAPGRGTPAARAY